MGHAGGLRAWSLSFSVLAALILVTGASACTDQDGDGSIDIDIDAAGDYHDPLDDGAATGTVRTITTQTLPATVPSPACFVTGNALYVVEDAGNLDAGDGAVLARLRELGLTVTVKSDELLVAGDANGKSARPWSVPSSATPPSPS
jgi:hypothetical protein